MNPQEPIASPLSQAGADIEEVPYIPPAMSIDVTSKVRSFAIPINIYIRFKTFPVLITNNFLKGYQLGCHLLKT